MKKSIFTEQAIQMVAIMLFIGLSFLGCNSSKKKSIHSNQIKGICITSTGGMKGNQMAISVDSALNYFYKETDGVTDSTSIFYGKITQRLWDSLNEELAKIPINLLDSNYKSENADCADFEILLT